MKYKYVLFDFDGTIADTEDVNFDIFQQLASKHNIRKIDKEEIPFLKKMSASQVMKDLNVKAYRLPLMLRQGKKILKENIVNINFCKDNTVEVIKELKNQGLVVGIITTNSKQNVKKFLKYHDAEVFDIVLSASMFGKESKFRKIMKKNKLTSRDILYVGDEIRDIFSAHKCNIDIASVSWGYNDKESLLENNPNYLIDEIEDLLDIINIS